MLMKPPHYNGTSYAGILLAEGEAVDVAPRDVEALKSEGWVEVSESEEG